MKNFKDTHNIAKVENWVSLKGYAGQELAFGRLMLCGFNVQRNLWRDASRAKKIILNYKNSLIIDIWIFLYKRKNN